MRGWRRCQCPDDSTAQWQCSACSTFLPSGSRMHRALEIQEILSNIFSHCSYSEQLDDKPYPLNVHHRGKAALDLAALARTCHAFKDPALDALWRDLIDLSPLVRCLPKASNRLSRGDMVRRFQVFVTLCLMNIFHLDSAILWSSIHLADRLRKPTGISFEVTHVVSNPYRTLAVDSTRNQSRHSQTLLPLGHSSQTSAFCIVNIQRKPCPCYTSLSHP